MKKRLNRYLYLAVLLLAMIAGGATDASATVYNWSRYDLSFETPDDGFVTFNSPTRFEIQ